MSVTPEGRIKAKLDAMLKRLGVWYFSPQSGPHGKAGIPDRIVCAWGVFVGVEAKADRTKKPTRLQQHTMKLIETSGGKCFVVFDDEGIAHVEEFIIRVGRKRGQIAGVPIEGPTPRSG